MTPRSLIAAILILLLMVPFWPSTMAMAGQPMPLKPTLTISALEPQEITVEISSTAIGSATFGATVTVDKPPAIGTVMVTLDASTSTGWPTTVTPSSIPFTSSGSVHITVTVLVPPETPSSSVGTVTVNGLGTYPGMNTNTATSTGTVKVKQYYRCLLTITPNVGTNNPQKYSIAVTNGGNGEDSFELSIPLQDTLSKAGLSVAFDKTATSKLAQNSTETINMKVSYGPTATTGKQQIDVRSTSTGSKTGGNGTEYTDALTTINVQPLQGSSGISIGVVALVIVIIVIVVILVAKKKGKLKFGRKPKQAAVKSDAKDQKEK